MKTKGDVIGIVSSAGTTVAKYSYGAWGKCTLTWASSTIGQINPFRYRGYYDSETGWYYLQSRYYDPTVGRFVNADDLFKKVGGVLKKPL